MNTTDPEQEEVYEEEVLHEAPKPVKQGIWQKLGGGSLSIAVILHVILLLVGAVWIFQIIREPEKKTDFLPGGGGGGGERGAQTKVNQKKQKQITPSTNVKRVFAEGASSSYSIPEQGDSFGEMSPLSSLGGGGMAGGAGGTGPGGGFGNGLGGGLGGLGTGSGKLFGLPESMKKRCSKEDRLDRLKSSGGTPQCEDAVLKSLRWLKSTQKPDGSWGDSYKAGRTGMALLAYFGHCETPASEEFGDSCMKAIVYLVNLGMRNNGKLSTNFADMHWCYDQALGTYALGEALTLCKEFKIPVPNLKEVTEKAGQFIIDNQHKTGGWAYFFIKGDTKQPGGHPDTSIAGWQVQALSACRHAGLNLRGMSSCISKALGYMNKLQSNDGGYGYDKLGPSEPHLGYCTLTGVGMLCHQMWGKGNSTNISKAAKYVLKNTRFEYNAEFCDLYGHYYESQAMMQRGGEEWQKYNTIFRDQVLGNQAEDGSWKMPGGNKKIRAIAAEYFTTKQDAQHYRTCMCTLMLEVYYRFLSGNGSGPI